MLPFSVRLSTHLCLYPLGWLPSSEFAGSEGRISTLTSPVYYPSLSVGLIKYSPFLSCIYLIFNSSSCLPPLPSFPAFLTHTPLTAPRVNNSLMLMFSHINPMKWIGNHLKSSRDCSFGKIRVELRRTCLQLHGPFSQQKYLRQLIGKLSTSPWPC